MSERPILFSGPMVRALLDGRKTQTRRIVKAQPDKVWQEPGGPVVFKDGDGFGAKDRVLHCPYGVPGDTLWVRETWCYGGDHPAAPEKYLYRADYEGDPAWKDVRGWRPSIHMPRVASRIKLTITDLRVQRVQDISEDDAEEEGVPACERCGDVGWLNEGPDGGYQCSCVGDTPRDRFRRLWSDINGPASWDANPWVWALTFTVDGSDAPR